MNEWRNQVPKSRWDFEFIVRECRVQELQDMLNLYWGHGFELHSWNIRFIFPMDGPDLHIAVCILKGRL